MEYVSGEQPITEAEVRPSLLGTWLRARMVLTSKRLIGTAPNTMFGLVPVGRTEITQPLDRISSVRVRTEFSLISLLVGLLLVFAGLGQFWLGSSGSTGLGVVLLVAGVVFGAGAWKAAVTVTDSGGGAQHIAVSPLDRSEAETFVRAVNNQIVT